MIKAILSNAIKIRLAIWALEMALPDGTEMKQRFRALLLGVVMAVAGGIIAACLIITLIIAGGFILYNHAHFSAVDATLSALAVLTLLIVITLIYGRQQLRKAFNGLENITDVKHDIEHEDFLEGIINGFIEGLTNKKPVE